MKLQHWLTIAAACAVSGPVCVWAQAVQGEPPPPATQPSVNRPEGAGSTVPNFVPDIDPALPNRRVPSLAPPRPLDGHPVTPDKAWPKPPAIKPALPSRRPDAGTIKNDELLSGKERPSIEESDRNYRPARSR
ncbi:hypothetical protein [Pollutimonas nitritireducens]|uniref:hypothetical protein n=1 Tax=Pollutimonas nitritireducens TaxID=2045209 RepID=UPI00117E7149|nr:hypothetical protein [Pollutimonas nitritireducens]